MFQLLKSKQTKKIAQREIKTLCEVYLEIAIQFPNGSVIWYPTWHQHCLRWKLILRQKNIKNMIINRLISIMHKYNCVLVLGNFNKVNILNPSEWNSAYTFFQFITGIPLHIHKKYSDTRIISSHTYGSSRKYYGVWWWKVAQINIHIIYSCGKSQKAYLFSTQKKLARIPLQDGNESRRRQDKNTKQVWDMEISALSLVSCQYTICIWHY